MERPMQMAQQTRPPIDRLAGLVDRLDALPSVPLIAERVGQLVNDPRSDARSIAAAMRGDPALTAKVLRLVNSPYFGIPNGVSDVARAISFIGFNTLHQLVLTVSVFKMLGGARDEAARALYRHSLAVAGAAEAIAEHVGHPAPQECFTAGLLHDIGRLALAQADGDLFEQVATAARARDLSLKDAEAELGLPPHDALGLRLAKRWRFPLPLQAAIGHHHGYTLAERSSVARHLNPTVDVTVLADAICHRLRLHAETGEPPPLPAPVLERLNVTQDIEQQAYDRLRWKMEQSELLMQILT